MSSTPEASNKTSPSGGEFRPRCPDVISRCAVHPYRPRCSRCFPAASSIQCFSFRRIMCSEDASLGGSAKCAHDNPHTKREETGKADPSGCEHRAHMHGRTWPSSDDTPRYTVPASSSRNRPSSVPTTHRRDAARIVLGFNVSRGDFQHLPETCALGWLSAWVNKSGARHT